MFALATKLQIALLAGFDLAYRLRKLWRQRQGHKDQAVFPNRSAAQRVLSLLPGETRGLCRGGLGQRQLLLQLRPGRGDSKAGLWNPVLNGECKPALQSGLVAAKFFDCGGEPVAFESPLHLR
jgi:hypothetical protein